MKIGARLEHVAYKERREDNRGGKVLLALADAPATPYACAFASSRSRTCGRCSRPQ